MSHSTQCECGSCQTRMETEQEEVSQARLHPVCFFDDQPATVHLNGVYLCSSHATCSTCLKPLTRDGLFCQCGKYGYSGHEELLWCSEACLDTRHAPPDMEEDNT